jgi:hypothetical protein
MMVGIIMNRENGIKYMIGLAAFVIVCDVIQRMPVEYSIRNWIGHLLFILSLIILAILVVSAILALYKTKTVTNREQDEFWTIFFQELKKILWEIVNVFNYF